MNQIQNLNINPDYLNLNLAKAKLVKQAITEVNYQRGLTRKRIENAEQKLKKLYYLKKILKKVERNFKIAIFVLIMDATLIPITFISTPIIALALALAAVSLGVNVIKEKQLIKHLNALCSQFNETRLRLEYNLPEWKKELHNADDAQKALQEEKEKLNQEQKSLQQVFNKKTGTSTESSDILEPNMEQDYPLTEKETEQFHAYQQKILKLKKKSTK